MGTGSAVGRSEDRPDEHQFPHGNESRGADRTFYRRNGSVSEFEPTVGLSRPTAVPAKAGIQCLKGRRRRWVPAPRTQRNGNIPHRVGFSPPALHDGIANGRWAEAHPMSSARRPQAFEARFDFTYAIGLTGRPFSQTSKWQCGPVARPVEPTFAIVSPACTRAPAS